MFYLAPLTLIANPHMMFNLAQDDDSDRASSPVSVTMETETSSIYSLRTGMEGLHVNSNVPTPAQELKTSSTCSMRVKMDALHINNDILLPGSFELHVDSTARGNLEALPPLARRQHLTLPDPSLKTFLTAATLILTENMPSHHHKLFSLSAEFYHTASRYLPEKLSNLTITDVVQSVERIVKSTYQKVFRPSNQFGQLLVWGFEQAKLTKPPTSTSLADATPKHELDGLRQLELLS
ncbi:hypothetical protein PQX77_001325 [Marasmius sp. AFHP31]|nr:hypothetical protein PQX77_001325 [Marasmius sp. AFHP31]